VRVNVQITCERCGERHGFIDLGPQELKELKSAKKIAELVGDLLPMFLRQGLEHNCPLTDAERSLIKEFLLSDQCPKCGGRVGEDPKNCDYACDGCNWRCSRTMLSAVKETL
jgi:hypothetical protein